MNTTTAREVPKGHEAFPYLKGLTPREFTDYSPNDELFTHETPDVILTLLADLECAGGAHLSLVVDAWGEGVKVYDLFEVETAAEIDSEWGCVLEADWRVSA